MKKLVNYIDKAKEKSGSDYKTAKQLNISKQAISFARSGRGMTPENCTKLALFLDVNPMEIIAASEITKHPEKAQFWGKWIAAASVILALFSITQAIDINTFSASLAFTPLYIMRSCILILACLIFIKLMEKGVVNSE